jgi:hypothetical protein
LANGQRRSLENGTSSVGLQSEMPHFNLEDSTDTPPRDLPSPGTRKCCRSAQFGAITGSAEPLARRLPLPMIVRSSGQASNLFLEEVP